MRSPRCWPPRPRRASSCCRASTRPRSGPKALELGAAAYIEKSAPIGELPRRLLAIVGDAPGAPAPPAADVVASAPADRPADAGEEEPDPATILAEHLERFRTVFDQAAIGMATLTLTGTIVRANHALGRLAGEPESALVGRRYTDLAPPADRDAIALTLARVVHGAGDADDVEHRIATGSSVRWAKSTLGTVDDTDGRPLYLFAQTEDITRRRHVIEELRQSEERFRLMVESVQDYAIFMLDAGGHVATWNLGAERLKGYRAGEIIGRHFRTFYPDDVAATGHPEHELAVATRDGSYEEEGWRIRKDGTRFWANVVITALFDQERNLVGFAKVTRDMTERRRAQDERERAAADLAASNRELVTAAQQTDEFLAVTAHELQSPVTAITGAADILLGYWDRLDGNERRDAIERIALGGSRIRRLLDDLLTASRLEAGSFAVTLGPVGVMDALSRALKEVRPVVADLDADIVVRGAEDVAVIADPERLVQILTNLLSNAAKYGKPPIVIDVRVREDEVVDIAVHDHGPGIPEHLAPTLFEKFARGGESAPRGTGLGLFIVRELTRLQGGDARYEESPGGGASFAVSFARADPPPAGAMLHP